MILDKPTIQYFLQLDRSTIDSFDLGFPSSLFFPDKLKKIEFCTQEFNQALQYGPTSQRLKEQVVEWMLHKGEGCNVKEVLLCNGAQEAIFLLSLFFLNSKNKAIVDDFFYPNFRLIVKNINSSVIPIKLDSTNTMNLNLLEEVLKIRNDVGCIYTVPNGHNPLGISLSNEKRKIIASLAAQYDVPIIEDDPYGFIHFDEAPYPPSIRFFNKDNTYYVGSFSKILGPSLRIGWIIAPEKVIPLLEAIKESMNLNNRTLSQHILSKALELFPYKQHLTEITQYYKKKRNLLVEGIQNYFPAETNYTIPSHGFFLWLNTPGFDYSKQLNTSIEQLKIAYMPGDLFTIEDKGRDCARFNYSYINEEKIIPSIKQLSIIFQR